MTRFESGILCAMLIYIAAYAYLYDQRKPACNLAYWAYTEGSDLDEECLYYGFSKLAGTRGIDQKSSSPLIFMDDNGS